MSSQGHIDIWSPSADLTQASKHEFTIYKQESQIGPSQKGTALRNRGDKLQSVLIFFSIFSTYTKFGSHTSSSDMYDSEDSIREMYRIDYQHGEAGTRSRDIFYIVRLHYGYT